jgi:hypothetical protein
MEKILIAWAVIVTASWIASGRVMRWRIRYQTTVHAEVISAAVAFRRARLEHRRAVAIARMERPAVAAAPAVTTPVPVITDAPEAAPAGVSWGWQDSDGDTASMTRVVDIPPVRRGGDHEDTAAMPAPGNRKRKVRTPLTRHGREERAWERAGPPSADDTFSAVLAAWPGELRAPRPVEAAPRALHIETVDDVIAWGERQRALLRQWATEPVEAPRELEAAGAR